jgi:hypothetical protein
LHSRCSAAAAVSPVFALRAVLSNPVVDGLQGKAAEIGVILNLTLQLLFGAAVAMLHGQLLQCWYQVVWDPALLV